MGLNLFPLLFYLAQRFENVRHMRAYDLGRGTARDASARDDSGVP